MSSKKRRFAFLICLMLCIETLLGSVVSFADKVSDLEKEKQELEQQKNDAANQKNKDQAALDAANSKASALEDDMSGVEEEIEEVDGELVETLAYIEIIRDDIALIKDEIAETEIQYAEAQKVEEEQYEAMKIRIRYMYEKGETTYLQLLIESQGFSDMMNKVEYVEKLYDYDRRLLLEYQEAKERTWELKEQLEEEKAEQDATLFELEEEKKKLNEILLQKQAVYADYSKQLKNAQAEAGKYKSNIAKQNEKIKKLEAESNKKQQEIEKAIKEEEEAKKKAEEEARKKALEEAGLSEEDGNAQKTQTTSKTWTSSGTSTTTSSQTTTTAASTVETDSSGNKVYKSAASYNSGNKGQDIVNYACQFVGNPYVYGGTSLTQGADCSGFIWRVYKDFGITIPRPGTSMRTTGTEVSYENARAGDIICYAGHVALYMGNGQIVHASTKKTGIKYGSATYKNIITIRRIV